MNVVNNKQKLRQHMIQKRKQLSTQYIKQSSKRICENLQHNFFYRQSRKILFYMSFNNEVDLRPAIEQAWEEGRQVVLPRVNVRTKTMDCYHVTSFDELIISKYGILEPEANESRIVDPAVLDVVVVPAVAFDKQGYRLGYGGGYYDRFFSRYRDCTRIGVAYPEQIVDTVYPESHDQKVDILITSWGECII
jgi:5-formyltetrahydrofolate cyclo-ligase